MPRLNDIGQPGLAGFGAGIAAQLPRGMTELEGTRDVHSPEYGNYRFSDGSVMVWIPAFLYRIAPAGSNRQIQRVEVKPPEDFIDAEDVRRLGFVWHRAFFNGGALQPGVFVDKYLCSNLNGVASSVPMAVPLSSGLRGRLEKADFTALVGFPSAALHGALAAAKTRGESFFCNTRFIRSALALLAMAHGQACGSTSVCAWWRREGPLGPRGCNNGQLGDVDDPTVLYLGDNNGEHWGAALTGSANRPAMVSHNGQACGVMDLAGPMWEMELGLTSDGRDWYALAPHCDVAQLQGGHTISKDAWGAPGLLEHYQRLGPRAGALLETPVATSMGSDQVVLRSVDSGLDAVCTGLGIPLLQGVGGHSSFGHDGIWAKHCVDAALLSGGHWASGKAAGIWALSITDSRQASIVGAGFRSARYL